MRIFKIMSTTLPNLKILIADDDTDDHYFIKKSIMELDSTIECCPVYNGIQLMDYLTGKISRLELADLPHFILLDINMPLLGGFGTLERLKAHPQLKHIPVFMMTTSSSPVHKEKALELGASGFYTKPVEMDRLKETISEIISIVLMISQTTV